MHLAYLVATLGILLGLSSPAVAVVERMAEDTPRATPAGTRFVAPADWSVMTRGTVTIIESPEGDSRIALCDVRATASEAAEAAAAIPIRPGGGAWSSVRDVLKYVAMELRGGLLRNGRRYVAESVLKDRRAPQVAIGKDATYGMGLSVGTRFGTPVVGHNGALTGFRSGMFWLPEHGVGAVVLTNSDVGWVVHATFWRKLLEVLFDGRPDAEADLKVEAEAMTRRILDDRKTLTFPPPPRRRPSWRRATAISAPAPHLCTATKSPVTKAPSPSLRSRSLWHLISAPATTRSGA
jgi:CubicO group peptidase (beta-lactamase class C family)